MSQGAARKRRMSPDQDRGSMARALVDAVAGAVAGGVSRTLTSPLDVIKIRFQVQLEPTSTRAWLNGDKQVPSKYTGIFQACRAIINEEGTRALWREDHMQLSPAFSFLSGALAGCAATLGSYPFDLLRTVLASQGEPKVYPNLRSAFVGILQYRGIPGLYAGLTPTLIEIIPYAGIQFGSYDIFKKCVAAWRQKHPAYDPGEPLSNFISGFAAGTSAKVCCHPLDVVKKRFQVEGLRRHPRYGARIDESTYRNVRDATKRIVEAEGIAGLYKGLFPSVVKAAPAAAITFVVYEAASKWLQSWLL